MAAPISHDLIANVLGRTWAFVSTFLFVPAYVYILGIDGFGVIALFLAVGSLVAFLDLGLSPTLARELHDQRLEPRERVDVLFSYEVVYIGIVVVVAIVALSIPGSGYETLLSAEDLARPGVRSAVPLVFVAAAVQLLLSFYVAGLMGVQAQVVGNVVIVAAGMVRNAAVLVPLWLYPEPRVYLVWQLAFAAVFAVIARNRLYRAVGYEGGGGRRFAPHWVLRNLHFTGGMFVVSLAAAINTQIDKLFIGKLVGLAALAEYTLAATFAQLLVFVISPITITMLPRFVYSASTSDGEGLRVAFFRTYRLVAAIVATAAGLMLFFGPYLISLWAVGEVSTQSVAGFSAPLVAGYALLALGTVPHAAAVANKDARAGSIMSLSLILTVPIYWYSIQRVGLLGAALTSLTLQAVVVPFYFGWVNTRYLKVERFAAVLASSFGVPFAASALLGFAFSSFVLETGYVTLDVLVIGAVSAASLAFSAWWALHRGDLHFWLGFVGSGRR